MSKIISGDPKAKDLLNKLSEDVSALKSDLASLFSRSTRHTIPNSARDLADYGREKFSSQLHYLRAHPGQSSAGLAGGLVLLGAVGFGIYWLCKSDSCGKLCEYRDRSDTDEDFAQEGLPPYIS